MLLVSLFLTSKPKCTWKVIFFHTRMLRKTFKYQCMFVYFTFSVVNLFSMPLHYDIIRILYILTPAGLTANDEQRCKTGGLVWFTLRAGLS